MSKSASVQTGFELLLVPDPDRLRLVSYSLLIALVAALGGCSHTPSQSVTPPVPLYQVLPETWWAIDEQIFSASVHARHESDAYARVTMDEWRWRVRKLTEDVFIPWYSSYWTQQWIATKVAWYKLQYTEGEAIPEERLVSYLQEQFTAQVLEPVSSFVDPYIVMQETTAGYLRDLKERLDPLPFDFRIPVDAFNQHVNAIPAIVVPAVPLQDASLYEVMQATDLSALPAYETLLQQITAVSGAAGPTPSPDRLQAVTRRAVTQLAGSLPLRGSATAASAIVGGFFGVLISAGAVTWSVVEHDQDKPGIEAQLRKNLDAALDLMWQSLLEDQQGGVTAVVHHMSTQIENATFYPLPLPAYSLEPALLF